MIIDCHGHYTTAPAALQDFRDAQRARLQDSTLPDPALAEISDDQIRESIENNQLRIARERGTDYSIFSPKASAMGHHVTDRAIAVACIAGAVIVLIVGYLGISDTPYVAEQLPYFISAGAGGIVLCAVAGMMWVSADLRDEWRELRALREQLAEETSSAR